VLSELKSDLKSDVSKRLRQVNGRLNSLTSQITKVNLQNSNKPTNVRSSIYSSDFQSGNGPVGISTSSDPELIVEMQTEIGRISDGVDTNSMRIVQEAEKLSILKKKLGKVDIVANDVGTQIAMLKQMHVIDMHQLANSFGKVISYKEAPDFDDKINLMKSGKNNANSDSKISQEFQKEITENLSVLNKTISNIQDFVHETYKNSSANNSEALLSYSNQIKLIDTKLSDIQDSNAKQTELVSGVLLKTGALEDLQITIVRTLTNLNETVVDLQNEGHDHKDRIYKKIESVNSNFTGLVEVVKILEGELSAKLNNTSIDKQTVVLEAMTKEMKRNFTLLNDLLYNKFEVINSRLGENSLNNRFSTIEDRMANIELNFTPSTSTQKPKKTQPAQLFDFKSFTVELENLQSQIDSNFTEIKSAISIQNSTIISNKQSITNSNLATIRLAQEITAVQETDRNQTGRVDFLEKSSAELELRIIHLSEVDAIIKSDHIKSIRNELVFQGNQFNKLETRIEELPDQETIATLEKTSNKQADWIKDIREEMEFLNNLTQSNFVSITGIKLKQPEQPIENLHAAKIPDFSSLLENSTPLNNFIPENGFTGDQNKLLADANILLDDLFRKVEIGKNPKPVSFLGDLTSTQVSLHTTTMQTEPYGDSSTTFGQEATEVSDEMKYEKERLEAEADFDDNEFEDFETTDSPNYVIDEIGMIDVSDVKSSEVGSQDIVSSGYLAEYLTDDE